MIDWEGKWGPGIDFTGPKGSNCFQGVPCSCSQGKFEKLCQRIDVLGYFEKCFLSITKVLVKLGSVIVRISGGPFAPLFLMALGVDS